VATHMGALKTAGFVTVAFGLLSLLLFFYFTTTLDWSMPGLVPVEVGLVPEEQVEESPAVFSPQSKCRERNLRKLDRLLLTSKAKYSYKWVKSLGLPYLIMDKQISDEPDDPEDLPYIVPSPYNYAAEVSYYLQFIVEYYECLPLRTLFIHGHDPDLHAANYDSGWWTNPSGARLENTSQIVSRLCWDQIPSFFSLTKKMAAFGEGPGSLFNIMQTIWGNTRFKKWMGDKLPGALHFHCCAQFVVHRDTIRKRPQAFWEEIYEDLLHSDEAVAGGYGAHGYAWSRLFEHIWEWIFGYTQEELKAMMEMAPNASLLSCGP